MMTNRNDSNFSGKTETLIIFGTKIWILLANIGTQSLLAWMLGPEGRGSFAVCLLFGTFMGVLFTFGVDRATQFHVRVNDTHPSRWFWGGIVILGIGVGSGVFTGHLLIESPFTFFDQAEPSTFMLSLWIIPLSVFAVFLQLQSEALRRFKQLGVFTVIQTTGVLLVTFGLLYFFSFGVNGALIGLIIGYAVAAILMLWDLVKNCGFKLELPQKTQLRALLSYGVRFYPARIGNLLSPQLGVLYLAILGGQREVGIFAAASALISKVGVFPLTLETALFPRVAKNPMSNFDLIDQSMRAAFLVTFLPLAAVLICSVPLVTILLSSEFYPAIPLLWILATGIIAKGGTLTLFAFFRAINSPETLSISMMIELFISTVAFVILYEQFGLVGGAWAIVIGNLCSCLVLFLSYMKISQRSVRQILCPTGGDITLLKQFFFNILQRIHRN